MVTKENAPTKRDAQYYYASSDMYQLLGCFMVRTEPEIAQALCSGALVEDITNILSELGLDDKKIKTLTKGLAALAQKEQSADDLFHAVRKDYTHLFFSPKFSVSTPYQSRFLGEMKKEGKYEIVIEKTIKNASAAYRKAGFESAIEPKLRSDHIAVEMEFMQVLRRNQGKAFEDGDSNAYEEIDATAKSFLEELLSKWAISLFKEVEEKANEEAYRFIGALGVAFFESETMS